MTADRLRSVVILLANAHWCRYWLHWNFHTRSPWVMALQVIGADGRPLRANGAEALGFEWDADDGMFYADRTNEDGTPFGGSGG